MKVERMAIGKHYHSTVNCESLKFQLNINIICIVSTRIEKLEGNIYLGIILFIYQFCEVFKDHK